MGRNFDSLDDFIQVHIKEILGSSGLPHDDASLETLASAWLEKKTSFEATVAKFDMEQVDSFSAQDERGALLLTYSGSLLNVGPLVEGVRHCEYVSIGIRADVPENAVAEDSVIDADLETDSVALFKKGPVRKTSPILRIAHFKKKLTPQIEQAKLAEVTKILGEEFIEVNKTVIR